jgi:hypothetical protein
MADYKRINSTGVIVPDFADTRSEVEARYRQIPGMEDIPLDPETPQGAFMLSEVLLRDDLARNNAYLANQINPNIADGVFFDAIFAFMGGERRGATYSIIRNVEMSGQPATVIPAGALVYAGEVGFKLLSTVSIGQNGRVYADFQAVESGPIVVGPGELTDISTSVLGWETATNANHSEVGRKQESLFKARRRRELTLALNASESVEALVSALYNLPDVRSL